MSNTAATAAAATSTAAASARTAPTTTPGNRLGFTFDPVPDVCKPLIKAKKLTALDALVLGMLLRERRFSESSPVSRCTKEKIASELGKSPSAIQASFARLKACGLIEHVCVGKPDPNDATNHTGYRVFFPFVTLRTD